MCVCVCVCVLNCHPADCGCVLKTTEETRRKQCTEGSSVPRHVAGWRRAGDLTQVRRCGLEEGHDDMVEHQGNIVESQQDQQTKLVAILNTECCYQTIQVLKPHDELSQFLTCQDVSPETLKHRRKKCCVI